MEYELPNGYLLSEEEIEQPACEWEEELWRGALVEMPAKGLAHEVPASAAEIFHDRQS